MKILSTVLAISMFFINSAPVFAQFGDVATPPPPVETPPVTAPVVPTSEPTPPPVEPTLPPTVNTEIVTQIVTVPSDNTGPVISGLANLSLATHNATIVWTTDELAVSTLEYGVTESYGTHPTLDAGALLAHTGACTYPSSGSHSACSTRTNSNREYRNSNSNCYCSIR